MNRNRGIYVAAAIALLLGACSWWSSPAHAADSRTFPETGHTVQGRFLTYWNNHGALAQQGYPISEELQEQNDTDGRTYTVQYFQRAVFEYHPEFASTDSEVLLSLLGVFYYKDKYGGNAASQTANPDNSRKFTETGKTLGGVFRQYWESHGGLAQQGYPISEEFNEVDKDGTPRTVQYFQRAVFEYHPEFAGTDSQVLLSLLGVSSYDKKHGGGSPPPQPPQPPQPPSPDNTGQVLFYNTQVGNAIVGHVDASGNYSDLKVAVAGGSTGWTHIVALGKGRLLWYSKSTGSAVVGQVATDGTYTDIAQSTALGAGWTHVVSAGDGLVFYYKAGTGTGGTAMVNSDGSITLLKVYTTFNAGWTNIVGLDNGVLVFYIRGTSEAVTARVNNDGTFQQLKLYNNWTPIWTNLVPGTNGTLLQYYSTDGRAAVSKFDTAGNETVLMRYDSAGEPPLPNPYPTVTGMSNGTLLFYNDATREGVTGRMSGDGSVAIYNRSGPNAYAVWTYIVGIR